MISTDASTPRNPKKPRLSRRLLSHFTLTLSVLLALSFVTLAVVGPTTQKAEAIAPIIVLGAGILIGAGIAALVDWLDDEKDYALINSESKDIYAQNLAYGLKTSVNFISGQISDAEMHQDLLSYYYIRKAQWAARELWIEQDSSGSEHIFDPTYVLENSYILTDMSEYINSYIEGTNNAFAVYDGINTNFVGAYSDLVYANYGLGVVNGYGDTSLKAKLNTKPLDEGLAYFNGNATLYYVKSGTSTAQIYFQNNTLAFSKDISGLSHTIIEIGKDELDLEPGIYKFGVNWRGPLVPIVDTGLSIEPSTIRPTMSSYTYNRNNEISGEIQESYGPLANGKYHSTKTGSTSSDIAAIYYDANYYYAIKVSGGLVPEGNKIFLKTLTDPLNGLLTELLQQQTNALNFAQSYYNTIVLTGDPGGDYGLPLMLMPDPSQMIGMDWEQLYALYLAYLMEAYQYYQDYADQLEASSVNITAESLRLKIRGSIVNETGVTLYDNTTIWTPFVTTDSITLNLGPNTWESAGYGIKWGNANNITLFNRSTGASIIDLYPGYTIYIQEILYDGELVTEIDLEVTNVQISIIGIEPPPGPPTVLTDLDWLISRWYYIAIIGGVICLLGAIATRNMPILAVGLVLIVAGAAGWYLAGDTSLLSWLSMEPTNLRAWLQRLR